MRATAVVWVLGEGSPPAQRMHRQACDGGAPPFPARRDRPPASHAPSPSCLHAPEQRPRVSCPLVLACRRRMRPAVELAAKVAAKCYAPGEFVPIGALYFLHNGTALWAAKVKRAGSSWGADILLSSSSLRLQFPARCMTYVWLYLVTEPMLRRVLESGRYPEMARLLHQTEVRWLVRRGLVRLAEERCLGVVVEGGGGRQCAVLTAARVLTVDGDGKLLPRGVTQLADVKSVELCTGGLLLRRCDAYGAQRAIPV